MEQQDNNKITMITNKIIFYNFREITTETVITFKIEETMQTRFYGILPGVSVLCTCQDGEVVRMLTVAKNSKFQKEYTNNFDLLIFIYDDATCQKYERSKDNVMDRMGFVHRAPLYNAPHPTPMQQLLLSAESTLCNEFFEKMGHKYPMSKITHLIWPKQKSYSKLRRMYGESEIDKIFWDQYSETLPSVKYDKPMRKMSTAELMKLKENTHNTLDIIMPRKKKNRNKPY